jgi:hypothetical protein
MLLIIFGLIIIVGIAGWTGAIARDKGYHFAQAFIISLISLLFFFIGQIIVLIVYAARSPKQMDCPYCHKPNYYNRNFCNSCGRIFTIQQKIQHSGQN